MTAKQKANRERFKKVVAEAKKLRKKNPGLTQAQAVKQAWAIMYSKKKVAGYSEVGNVPLSKYEVGDSVYSYQNKTMPAKIVYKKFVPWESLSKPNSKDKFVYKLKLSDGFSNWINEESLSKSKTGMGAVKKKAVKKKATPKKSTSYHKDTKSHNVNIRVVSGLEKMSDKKIAELSSVMNKIRQYEAIMDLMKTNIKLKKYYKSDVYAIRSQIKYLGDRIKNLKLEVRTIKKHLK